MTRLIRSPLKWVVVVMDVGTLIIVASLHSWQWALGTGLIGLAWAAILLAIREPSVD
jgi:hypothetical protein